MLLSTSAFVTGCSAGSQDDGDEAASALEALPDGLSDVSAEADGVRMLANDRRVGADVLTSRAGLSPAAAADIVAARKNRQGAQRWYRSVHDVLLLPAVSTADIQLLVRDAVANGYVERPGFDDPVSARLSIPDATPRPRESDITVEAGFDGLAPDAAVALVRSRLTNVVDPRNESFVETTVRRNHKAFTIAAWNLLGRDTPPAVFARNLRAEKLTLLGTMSAVKPTILLAETGTQKTYYARGDSGAYERLATAPTYPVIMRVGLRLAPLGIRVFYPDWSATVLEHETATIVEQ